MKRSHFYKSKIKNDHGITVIFVAVVLLLLIGMASLAIDIGYIAVAKTELQNAADAAALAAGRELGLIYINTYDSEPVSNELSQAQKTQILSAAQSVVRGPDKNTAGGKVLDIRTEDIQYAVWQGATAAQDAITITLHTTIEFFFAKVLGVNSVDISADATAAMTSLGYVRSDLIPVGISSSWFDNFSDYCNQPITLYPVSDPCVSWHSFGLDNVAPGNIINVLRDMYNDLFETGLSAGDSVNVTGDTGSEGNYDVYDYFRTLYEVKGYDIDAEGNPVSSEADRVEKEDTWLDTRTGALRQAYLHEFPTNVIVYKDGGACNNSEASEIIGYARVTIKDVFRIPDKKVEATIKCDPVDAIFIEGRGAGKSYYGLKGAIPTLVE